MMRIGMGIAATAFGLLLAPAATQAEVTGTVRVINGDTLEMQGQTVKLYGIDALEEDQICLTGSGRPWSCGLEAASALSSIIGGAPLRCEPKYNLAGAILAVCTLSGDDIGAMMVRSGWALADRSVSFDYAGQEDQAHSSQAGVWSSEFVLPWEWREGKRLEIPEIDQSKPTEEAPPQSEAAPSNVPAYGPLNMGP